MPTPADNSKPVIVVSANSCWALTNYRLGLLKALQNAGYSLVALVPCEERASALEEAGLEVRPIPISAHGTSPLGELRLLYRYVRLLRELKPAAFLGFTVKPNIYGALAGRIAGVPVINNITGLGLVFTTAGPLRTIVRTLYRIAFRRSHCVFFQNRESRDLFVSGGLVNAGQAALLPGSGIDLERFKPGGPKERTNSEFIFLLPARLMWQKGIGEYCDVARRLRAEYPGVRFQLAGPVEPESHKGAIPRRQIDEWQSQGIEYLGAVDDILPLIDRADCILLPSYYPEGVPRALIEAAAMGKPVITTDMPGCRDVVEAGKTGYLCDPRSVQSLAAAMLQLIAQPPANRLEMGRLARMKVEREFDERIVIDAYLAALHGVATIVSEVPQET